MFKIRCCFLLGARFWFVMGLILDKEESSCLSEAIHSLPFPGSLFITILISRQEWGQGLCGADYVEGVWILSSSVIFKIPWYPQVCRASFHLLITIS